MSLFQFACPHCGGQFQVEDPPPGLDVACPHCGRRVAIPEATALSAAPEESAAADTYDPAAAVLESLASSDAPAESYIPLDFIEPPAPVTRRGGAISPPAEPSRRAPLGQQPIGTRQQIRSRQRRRSLLVMIGGLIVLGFAVVLLSQFSNQRALERQRAVDSAAGSK